MMMINMDSGVRLSGFLNLGLSIYSDVWLNYLTSRIHSFQHMESEVNKKTY